MSTAELAASTPQVPAPKQRIVKVLKNLVPIAMAVAIWFFPVPEGLTPQAWHLFAIFVTAIVSVLLGFYPLLTSTMLAAGTVVLTNTVSPAKAFAGFANSSVLLVVIAFLVAQAVVKSGLGRRISLFMVACSDVLPWGSPTALSSPMRQSLQPSPATPLAVECSIRSCSQSPRDRALTPKIPRAAGWAGI